MGCRAIHAFLFSREAFYIRSTLMPAMRYKVRAKPYETTRLSLTDMTFTVEFDLPSGFREAFQTTQEADFSNDAAAW